MVVTSVNCIQSKWSQAVAADVTGLPVSWSCQAQDPSNLYHHELTGSKLSVNCPLSLVTMVNSHQILMTLGIGILFFLYKEIIALELMNLNSGFLENSCKSIHEGLWHMYKCPERLFIKQKL